MTPEANGRQLRPLTISLQLSPALDRVGSPGTPLNGAVSSAICQAVDGLMEILGIPGRSFVVIDALDAPLPHGQFMCLAVEDQVLRYPDETVQFVYCWSVESVFRVDLSLAEVVAWLIDRCESEETWRIVAGFLSQLSLEILKAQPSVLLGTHLFEDYRASLPIPADGQPEHWPPDPEWLHPILVKVLSLGISIADKQTVADTLGGNPGEPWLEACEHLIDALRPGTIEIHVRRDYLRELTTVDADNRTGLLAFLRGGLFQELGVEYPKFHLVLDPKLGPRQFSFTINHISCLPLVGLGPDECLVNETPERLTTREISLRPAGNPSTILPNSLTHLENKTDLERSGYTTWDQMGYLILSLAAILRRNGHCLIDRDHTENFLQLAGTGYPELAKAVLSAFSVELITAVLRNLAREELSIRNSRLILEAFLDFHLRKSSDAVRPSRDVDTEGVNQNASDLRKLTEFIRAGMKRQVSGKMSRETDTIVVYLLDEEFDKLLAPPPASGQRSQSDSHLTTSQENRILEAIRREIVTLPPTAQMPAILTVAHLRWPLRRTIEKELPRIHVVSFDELMPNLNVFPVARISALVD